LNFISRRGLRSLTLVTIGWCYASPVLMHAAPAGFAMQSAAQDKSQTADLTGSWQLSWTDANGNPKKGTLSIKQDAGKLSGTFTGQRGTQPLSGTLQGSHVVLNIGPSDRQFTLEGDVDGSKLNGTLPEGSNWSAARQ